VTLVKTSALNAVAVVVRILTAIGLNKVLALYIGPAGYALVGHFSNVVAVAGAFAGTAVGNGVTKYTAEFHDAEEQQRSIWRAAARYVIVSATAAMLGVVLLSKVLSTWLMGDSSYQAVFICLGVCLPVLAINALLLAIMNGKKEVHRYVAQNIISSVLVTLASVALAVRFGLTGALFALALNQVLVWAVTVLLCRKTAWFSWRSFIGPIRGDSVRRVASFASMTLTSALVAPVAQVAVRDHLIDMFGQTAAGEWQAVFKMSEVYLLLFTATLSIYYLPRLSEIRDSRALWAEIAKVCRFVLPLAVLAALTMYLLREWLTVTLFSDRFLGMIQLLGWQLVGDVLKVGSWIFSYVLIGRAMVRWFIATEVIFCTTWVVLTVMLTHQMGLVGAPVAFAINYGVYWLCMGVLVRKEATRMIA
jgi:polysaccharide transporter, PST family